MKTYKLKDFTRGWICGDFQPSVINSKDFEVGIRELTKHDDLSPHFHSQLVELTVVLSGVIKINNTLFYENDIVYLEKEEPCFMEIISDKAKLLFIKSPSIPSDKTYIK